MSVDTSQLDRLARDLTAAAGRVQRGTYAAAQASAKRMEADARARVSGHAHLPHYPASIASEVHRRGLLVEATLGPDKGQSQGPLWNIIEFGTSKNAPIPHYGPALDAESGSFGRALGLLAGRL